MKATTIPSNNTSSFETPNIDIHEFNIKEATNCTHMWTAEEWTIKNAPNVCYDAWYQQPEQNNLWDYNIKIIPEKERPCFPSPAVTTRQQHNAASGEHQERFSRATTPAASVWTPAIPVGRRVGQGHHQYSGAISLGSVAHRSRLTLPGDVRTRPLQSARP